MRPSSSRLIGTALLALAAGAAAFPRPAAMAATAPGAAFEFRPGVVVDGARRVAYVMNLRGGIDAVDLRSGQTSWTTSAAQKPLLILPDRLLAQVEADDRHRLALVVLDLRRQGAPGRKIDVELEEGVQASIDDGPGVSFGLRGWPLGSGAGVIWSYREQPIRAIRDGSRPAEKRWEGAARIDLETGKVTSISPREAPDIPAPAAPRTRLALERAGYTFRYASADNRHFLASRRAGLAYEWLIMSRATGERVAKLANDVPAAWFFLAGPLLVHEVQAQSRVEKGVSSEESRKLRAIDLRTGAERWVHPFRDTAYRGAFPPRPPGNPSGATTPNPNEPPTSPSSTRPAQRR